MAFLSDRSKYAKNAIEAGDLLAEKLMASGKKVAKVSRGDPAYYIPTAKYIIDAYVKALREGKTSYSKAQGANELLDAIAARHKRRYGLQLAHEDITVTQGISEALYFINSALVNPGEQALLIKPYFPSYMTYLQLAEGTAALGRYDENDGWNVHTEGLAAMLAGLRRSGRIKRIKYMMVTNPNNPTGTVLRRKKLEQIVDLANEYGLFLVSDEIYDEIVYNGARFTSIAEVAHGVPYAMLNGVSKVYDATGFRIGYTVVPGQDKRSVALKRIMSDYCTTRLSPNTPAEYASAAAMDNVKEHAKDIKRLVGIIEKRVNFAVKMLKENPYMDLVRPNGAFYLFPRLHMKEMRFRNDEEFVSRLLKEQGVQTVWGTAFGAPGYVRIVGLAPKEILEYAIDKINNFCRKNAKK